MRKFFVVFGVMCAALTSNAVFLYWQVSDEYTGGVTDYEFVRLSYTYKEGETTKQGKLAEYLVPDGGMAAAVSTDLSTLASGTTYSLFVELMNYNSASKSLDLVGVSTTPITYTAGATSSVAYIDDGGGPVVPVSAAVWHGGSVAVPEPTSGMMVVMGFAFLALKHRKV